MTTATDGIASVYVSLIVDNTNFGMFTTCEGLGCEIEVTKRPEGGNNAYVPQLPGRITYQTIKLTRPLDATSSKIAAWVSSMANRPKRSPIELRAMSSDGMSTVASWTLIEAFPVRWTGPSFNVGTAAALTETIELAHHGFLSSSTGV
ncbi:MAG TPA: phage tail protein [Acidimicrobiales bacterium]|jgi:phage tail-like protein|nr:phage tail protein [Acidimicrobiales bacterium]